MIESAAKATLEDNTIRVTLPLSAPAGPESRVTMWLASPRDAQTGETTVELKPGAREATATFAWPTDLPEVSADEIGWYRIGYRLQANASNSTRGILSIGAITPDLMVLRIAYPRTIPHGQGANARVIAVNPVTDRPVFGVKIKATLSDDDADSDSGKTASQTREATSSRSGEAIFTFAPLGDPDDSLDLTVEGTLTGETVHLRALVIGENGHVLADEPMTVEVQDGKSRTVEKAEVKTNRFGIATYDWKTTDQTASDDYEVTFDLDNRTSGGSTGGQTIRIQRYELPEFSVTVTPDRPFYLNGDVPSVKIHAGYLFGKPVATGTIRIVRADNAHWNWRTGKYDEPKEVEEKAELNASGDATVNLKVTDDFDELKNSRYERYRDLQYRAMVTDATTGRTEPRNFVVRLSPEPVHIYLNPIGTNQREGEYLLSTSFADGSPAPCKVTLDWMDAQSHPVRAMAVKTNRYGLARVTLHYPASESESDKNGSQIRMTALDSQGRSSHFDDSLWLSSQEGLWLSLDHPLLRSGQRIEGTIHYRSGEQVDLDVLSGSTVLQHWQIRMSGQEQQFSIPSTPSFHGLVTLRAYNMRGGSLESYRYRGRDGATRSVLFPEDHSLSANVKGLAGSYAPGAKVNAELALRGPDAGAVAGIFGVSVVDTAVEQRAETEAEANSSWFGRGYWWLQGPAVADVTLESLNKTDMSGPVAADLELAAEAVLMNIQTDRFSIEADDDDDSARNDYQREMTTSLRPLKDAILSLLPSDLPATFEDLKKFSKAANVDDAILIDPWNVPYKVESSEGPQYDIRTLRSAGPDKQFGTSDDFTVTLVQRNVFAVPGTRLDKLLQDAVNVGKSLPPTITAMKQLAREAGLDLDSAAQHTLDRNGHPYSYMIELKGKHYFVRVSRDSGETVWQSSGIDYFGPTEARLNSALEKWTAAKNAFPETESDARRAFADAGIDFESLRDPLGRPFAIKARQQLSYAHVDQVKAGNTLQGETARVTLVAEVIQILRTDENATSFGTTNELARFAHTISQQSGSDFAPVAVDFGLFKGNTGAIGGTVMDQSGASIPGANVEVNDSGGHAEGNVVSKTDGTYIVSNLPPGFYKISVSANGFRIFVVQDVRVSSSALTTVDVTLLLGSVAESVEVTADAAGLAMNASAEVSRTSFQLATGPNGSAKISEATMTPRLRHVFEETAFWSPVLETNNAGHAAVSFTLPDSLTTWKLRAVGSTKDGRITEVNQTFKTFQPFFVDLDTPQVLTSGDEIALPVNLRNYTPHSITLPVNVKIADWFTLSTPASTQSTIAANGTAPVILGLRAAAFTNAGLLRVTAANAHDGDAVEKTVKVHPDGEPRTVTASELLRAARTTVKLYVPADAISGSMHTQLLLYPNLGTNVVHSMQAVLERPYGCAEQTISSSYPSLLYLQLTSAANSQSPQKSKAEQFLQQGYDRLLGYFGAHGGVTYWGASDPDEDAALTAYGIEFLTESEPFVDVDRGRIVAAIQWLLARQNANGSWNERYGATSARQALYIASALATAMHAKDFGSVAPKPLTADIKQSIAKAEAFAATSVAALHDPYSNALRLMLAVQSGDSAAINRQRAELIGAAERQNNGAHWEFDGYSPFYGWGSAGRLETTALVLMALQSAGNPADETLESEALLYLLQNRDGYGVWLSGQATTRVLKALVPVAVKQLQTAAPRNFVLQVNGRELSGEQAEALKADSQLLDAPRTIDLTSMIQPGTNVLEFSGASDAALASAQITTQFYIPWKQEDSAKRKLLYRAKTLDSTSATTVTLRMQRWASLFPAR